MPGLVLSYLLIINAIAFAAFAVDKQRAISGAWRIPEQRLLQLAAAGGVLGALTAQRLLRHKTRKEPFRTWLLLIGAVEGAAAVVLTLWWLGHTA